MRSPQSSDLVIVIDDVPLVTRKGKVVAIGPAAQGSKRALGPGRMIEQSWRVDPWRKFVATKVIEAMRGQETFSQQPVAAEFVFYMKRPKSHFRANGLLRDTAPAFPLLYPDVDKLARAVMDALTAGSAWDDDARVVDLTALKRYARQDQPVGVVITLRLKEDDDGRNPGI